MGNKNKKSEKKGFFQKLFNNVTDNVKEGATLVGEKVAETSAKAYVAGSELVADTSEKIHDYTEKQALHKEEHKLKAKQLEIKHKFGNIAFDHYLKNDSLHKPFLTSKPVSELVDEYHANEKRIKDIAKEVKKLENH